MRGLGHWDSNGIPVTSLSFTLNGAVWPRGGGCQLSQALGGFGALDHNFLVPRSLHGAEEEVGACENFLGYIGWKTQDMMWKDWQKTKEFIFMALNTHQEQLYVTWDSNILVPHNLICVSWWKMNARLKSSISRHEIYHLWFAGLQNKQLKKEVQSSVTKGLCCLLLLLEQYEDYLLCT